MMKVVSILWAFLLLLIISTTVYCEETRVVVIPLGGDECQGNAQAEEVLESRTFSNATKTNITGTMPNIGEQNMLPGVSDQTIYEGYHSGDGVVAGDADLVSGNIKSGVEIFGVSGQTEVVDTTSGDAVAGNILADKKAWVDGAEVTGAMSNVGAQNITPGTTNFIITQGYHDGSGQVTGDVDLVSGNIRSGVTLFGVGGDDNVVDTSSGNAVAGNIMAGNKAWVDGAEITGAMSNIGAQNITPGTTNVSITQGYHDGSGRVTGDADLVSGNIRSGVNIFGVAGNGNVVDTSSGNAAAANISLGKKAWVDGNEVTGTLAGGVPCTGTFSSLGRWCDNGDGTVTDTTTGLIWLKNWNYYTDSSYYRRCTSLTNLTTGGVSTGTWRMPTRREFEAIMSGTEPVSSSTPRLFTNIQSANYWTSTFACTDRDDRTATVVHMGTGAIDYAALWDGDVAYYPEVYSLDPDEHPTLADTISERIYDVDYADALAGDVYTVGVMGPASP